MDKTTLGPMASFFASIYRSGQSPSISRPGAGNLYRARCTRARLGQNDCSFASPSEHIFDGPSVIRASRERQFAGM